MKTILHSIQATAKRLQPRPCLHYKVGAQWCILSWDEMWCQVMAWARGLIALGLREGDRVAILSQTRFEWTIADLSILAAGGIVVPIYVSLTSEHVSFIARDADIRMAFVDARVGDVHRKALQEGDRTFIHFGEDVLTGMIRTSDLVLKGKGVREEEVVRRLDACLLNQPATYVYTSGTTGRQKGVVLTHGNIAASIDAACQAFHFLNSDHIGLVCLPLPHVLGRMTQLFQLAKGCQSAFAESLERLAENYREVRPHFVVGVPRMLEKMYERIQGHVATLAPWKRKFLVWALSVGALHGELVQYHRHVPFWLTLKSLLASLLVVRPLRKKLGGRLEFFVSGGAPLAKDIARFFMGAGLMVLEGYGLTETFAAVTVNRPDDFHFGTVGKPLAGVQIRLASDSEVLVKGPMVFREYLHLPEESALAFDEAGWFKTGDIGEYSKDGFLRITDRKKDLIITAGGKNIAPQPIERLLTESPYIDMAMVYGDQKKYLTALITLVPDAIARYAREHGVSPPKRGDGHVVHPVIADLIRNEIAVVNAKLASFETIKHFAIVPYPFSIEGGELTPTLKIRRKEIGKKYHQILEGLYQE